MNAGPKRISFTLLSYETEQCEQDLRSRIKDLERVSSV